MSDVKFSQYEEVTALPAWRSKRLGFESATKLVEYCWADGNTSQLLSLDSGTLAVVNTISSMKIVGWLGASPTGARVVFEPNTVSVGGGNTDVRGNNFYADNVYIGTTQKNANWDSAYTGRVSSATAPMSFSSNVVSLLISPSLTVSGGYLNVTTPSVTVHNSLTSLQGGSIGGSQYYHLDANTFNTVGANTVNWTSAYSHVSSDGSSHAFLNQAVTTGASPTFANVYASSGMKITSSGGTFQLGADSFVGTLKLSLVSTNSAIFQIYNGTGWTTAMTLSI